MGTDILRNLAQKQQEQQKLSGLAQQQAAIQSIQQARTEQEARDAAAKEMRKVDIYGRGYAGTVQKQLDTRLQQLKAGQVTGITSTALDTTNYIQLSTNEWVAKTDFNKLNIEDQAKLKELGVSRFNTYIQQQQANFIKDNIQLKTGEYVPKADYDKLDATNKSLLMEKGVKAFNDYQVQQLATFKTNNVQLKTGEYVPKTEYNKLPTEWQQELSGRGTTGFNTWIKTAYGGTGQLIQATNPDGTTTIYGATPDPNVGLDSAGNKIWIGGRWPESVKTAMPKTSVYPGAWPTEVSTFKTVSIPTATYTGAPTIFGGTWGNTPETLAVQQASIQAGLAGVISNQSKEQLQSSIASLQGASLARFNTAMQNIQAQQGTTAQKLAAYAQQLQGQFQQAIAQKTIPTITDKQGNELVLLGTGEYMFASDFKELSPTQISSALSGGLKSIYYTTKKGEMVLKDWVDTNLDAIHKTRLMNEGIKGLEDLFAAEKTSFIMTLPTQQQRNIFQSQGLDGLTKFVSNQEKVLEPFKVTIDGKTQYNIVDAILASNKHPELRAAIASLYPESVVKEADIQAKPFVDTVKQLQANLLVEGKYSIPKEFLSDADYHKLQLSFNLNDAKRLNEYAKAYPNDPRIATNTTDYNMATTLQTIRELSPLQQIAYESQYNQQVLSSFNVKLEDYLKEGVSNLKDAIRQIKLSDSVRAQLKNIDTKNLPQDPLDLITIAVNPNSTLQKSRQQIIQGIDTTKEKVANIWTDKDLDEWLARNPLNPVFTGAAYTGNFIFGVAKSIGAEIPLTLLKSNYAFKQGDMAQAALEIAALTGGFAMFPTTFAGGVGENIYYKNYPKAAGSVIGLGLTMVAGPEAVVKYGQRALRKVVNLPEAKTFSPSAGSITMNIPMSELAKGKYPDVVNTMDVLQTYLKDGVFPRDRIILDSTGKLEAQVTPLARAGITDHFHVTNRFNEYTDVIKQTGKVADLKAIASRDSPFPGEGAYFSPNISLRTGAAIEPVGSKTGIIGHKFEFKQVPIEVQSIYNELSKLDLKRTPFDVIDTTLNRAVDKYLELEKSGMLEPGTYPSFKLWNFIDYNKLLDIAKEKGMTGIHNWNAESLTAKQVTKLNEFYKKELDYYGKLHELAKGKGEIGATKWSNSQLDEFYNKLTGTEQSIVTQASIDGAKAKSWMIENESYRTSNAPLYPTKVTSDTRIRELGDTSGGSYIRASENIYNPDGKLVIKKGDKAPIMWLSEKPGDFAPSLSQRITAEYVHEPLTALRRLFGTKKQFKIGYGGIELGDLYGLKVSKRPNVNDYLDIDTRATAVMHNPVNKEQILVGRQYNADTGLIQPYFDTIGGSPFKLGESPIETIVREVTDEAGVYATGGKYVGLLRGRHMNTKAGTKYIQTEKNFNIYEVEYKGIPKPSAEIVELAWYDGKNLFDMSGKQIREKVSDITPKIYDMAKQGGVELWQVVEPKRAVETSKPQSYKMEGGKWTVKEKPEQAIVAIEDTQGNLLTINGQLPIITRQSGQTVWEAIRGTLKDKGIEVDKYGYVQTWMDFPEGYSFQHPGQITDFYVVKAKPSVKVMEQTTIQKLQEQYPREMEAYLAKKSDIYFRDPSEKLTNSPSYIGLDLPNNAKTYIAEVQNKLTKEAQKKGWNFIDWQPKDKLHITLKYNGIIPERIQSELTSIVNKFNDSLATKPLDFSIKEWEAWPNYKDMEVISVRLGSIKDMNLLTDLQRSVDAAATKAGLASDSFRFEPHITIGKIKEGTPIERKMELGGYLGKNPLEKTVDVKANRMFVKSSENAKIYEYPDTNSAIFTESKISKITEKVEEPVTKGIGNSLETDNATIKVQHDSFKGLTEVNVEGTIITLTELKVKKEANDVYVNGKRVTGTVPINYGDYIRIGDKGIAFIPKEVGEAGLLKAEAEFSGELLKLSKAVRERLKSEGYTELQIREMKPKEIKDALLEVERKIRESEGKAKPTTIELFPSGYRTLSETPNIKEVAYEGLVKTKSATEYYPSKASTYIEIYPDMYLQTYPEAYIKSGAKEYALTYPETYPEVYPSVYPTTYPSKFPTAYPSVYPTAYPVKYPTTYPSIATKYPAPTIPKYPVPPTPKKPPIPITTITKGGLKSFEELTYSQKEASIAWKQGWAYHLIYPPWNAQNVLHSKEPFPGIKIHTGIGSASKSLAQVKGETLPDKILWDLGIVDITFAKGYKNKVGMTYKSDIGDKSKIRKAIGAPTVAKVKRIAVTPSISGIG